MQTASETHPAETTRKHNFNGLIVGTTRYHAAARDDVHFHESPTICFFLSGGAIEKRGRQAYERYADDARFYHAAEPHQSSVQVFPSKCINLEFEAGFLRRHAISENAIARAAAQSPEMKFTMLKMHRELLAADELAPASIEMLLFALLAGDDKSARKLPVWLPALHDLLRDRWAENLSLDELSAALGAHPVTISKYFRRHFACTLGEYMRRLKIERSLWLVKNTTLSLTDIALDCGFADQSHFTRNFKNMTGFLPKDFRRL